MQRLLKPYIYIIVAISVRLLLFFYQTTLPDTDGMDMFARYGCDTPSYFNPVENLIENGTYNPDFRMPGYAAPYYVLRLFLTVPDTYELLALLQVLLSGLAVYFLALTAFYITGSKRVFHVVFIVSLLTFYNAVYDAYLLTESFCTSAGIFAVYFLVKGLKNKSLLSYLVSGVFFCWMIFLKPVYLGLLLIILAFLIFLFIRKTTRSLSSGLSGLLLLMLPFVVVDTLWVVRNYNTHGRVRLLTNPFFAPPDAFVYQRPMTKFLQSWGGTHSVWLPHGHNLWFEGNKEEEGLIRFPAHLVEGTVNKDSLFMLREYIMSVRDTTLTMEERLYYDTLAAQALERFTGYVKDEQPLMHYIGVPLHYLRIFYAVPGTYLLFIKPFNELSYLQKTFLLIIACLHYLVLAGGSISAIWVCVSGFFNLRRDALHILVSLIVIFTILIFPVILRMPDARFMAPAFPFMILTFALLLKTQKFL